MANLKIWKNTYSKLKEVYNENLEDDHSLKDYEVVLDRGDRDLQYLPFEHAQ